MFETPEQLLAAIQLGEDSHLEFKEMIFAGDKLKGPTRDTIADSLAAFANAKGGVFLLGVRDRDREIVGIPRDKLDVAEQIVREICISSIKPPLEGAITKIELPALDGSMQAVLRVDVDRSLSLHQSPGGHFARFGASRRALTTDQIVRLAQQRSHSRLLSFDEEIVANVGLADLEPGLVERFRVPDNHDTLDVLARKLGMMRIDPEGAPRATVAGVLIGAARPATHIGCAWIQAVCYRGIEPEAGPGYQIDAKDIHGPLDLQIAEASAFVFRNMKVGASKVAGRMDVPQYDMTAIFEAMVNAVAHRDYSLMGSHIRVRMFADRVEIRSPGGLANGLDVESISERQVSRNSVLASLLARIHVPPIEGLQTTRGTIMDRRGEGVPLILRRTEALAGKRPEIQVIDDTEMVVRIPAASAGSGSQ